MIGAVLAAPFRLVGLLLTGIFRAIYLHPWKTTFSIGGCVGAVLLVLLALTFDRFPVVGVQRGFRGVGMLVQYNPRTVAREAAYQQVIAPYPPVKPAGVAAEVAYKNIQVLKGVDANEFLRLMAAMSNWLQPSVGCAFCHSAVNMADDKVYTKTVARKMIQMTRYINTNWRAHVGAGGVWCNTCHRGAAVPNSIWFITPPPGGHHNFAETQSGEDAPSTVAGLTALPNDPFLPFLLNAATIRDQGRTALPDGNRMSTEQTNWTYSLMIHFAQSLGVSCNFCHNSRAFGEWDQSSPQRLVAWTAIEMVRDINRGYMLPLTDVFPPGSRGPLGDVPKINCATCHAGAYKPFYGASVLSAYPALEGGPDTPPHDRVSVASQRQAAIDTGGQRRVASDAGNQRRVAIDAGNQRRAAIDAAPSAATSAAATTTAVADRR